MQSKVQVLLQKCTEEAAAIKEKVLETKRNTRQQVCVCVMGWVDNRPEHPHFCRIIFVKNLLAFKATIYDKSLLSVVCYTC